uniref:Uncharacterized protein n=1 Tax=Timema genevievae TaxID=629358 RepID=A0A7R9JQW0_TIMGE|nr:unnamed protein product [Timema genevievae]
MPIWVLMKDIVTPVPPEEVRGMIKKCLETAALVNYTRLSAEAKIEESHPQYTRPRLNTNLPVFCSIIYYEISDLDLAATEVGRT